MLLPRPRHNEDGDDDDKCGDEDRYDWPNRHLVSSRW